ncbi:MAG: YbaN family protein [Bacteroidales bacterium]
MLHKEQKPLKPIVRFLMVTGGVVSVTLGIIGIALPLLPTTPFLLLAAYLFLRSSQRLYRWLLTHRVFGSYIRNYIHHRSISKSVKVSTLIILWATICISAYFMKELIWVQLLLLLVAIGVSIHVLSLRTMPKNKTTTNNSDEITP